MITPTCDTFSVAEMIKAWAKEDAQSGIVLTDREVQYKGRGQEPKMAGDLDTVDLHSNDPWPIVGLDNRVYEERHGLIECLAAAKLPKEEPDVYIKKIDWAKFPSEEELAYLYKSFFSQYDREVLMLIGWCRDGAGFRFHVPLQEGSTSLVKWTADDAEMGEFQEECSWVGTIHVHPGNSSSPSQTDIDDWAIPEKSGLHLIFGKDGTYSIHGAIAGRTFEVGSGAVTDNSDLFGCYITTSGNKPCQDLLLRPKPIVVKSCKSRYKGAKHVRAMRAMKPQVMTGTKDPTNEAALRATWLRGLGIAEALEVKYEDAWDLSVVMAGGAIYILTPEQYQLLEAHCRDNKCALPKTHTLTLKGGGL